MSDIIKFRHPDAVEKPQAAKPREGFNLSDMVDGAMPLEKMSARQPREDGALAALDNSGLITFPTDSTASDVASQPPMITGQGDWTNQELASLYRINRLLCMADPAIDTDRGVSDEGDPWFVFIDGKGDVFVHLCRIGDDFLFDSPAQERVVISRSLNELVDAFRAQAEAAENARADSQANVVRLTGQKNSKVMLHPGAALAALVWTVYVSTGDHVAPVSAQGAAASADEDGTTTAPLADTTTAELGDTAEKATLSEEAALVALDVAAKEGTEVPLSVILGACAAAETRHDTKGGGFAGAVNTVGIGLSALALTCGLDLWLDKTALDAATADGLDDDTKAAKTTDTSEGDSPDTLQDLTWGTLQHIRDFASALLTGDFEGTKAAVLETELASALATLESILRLFPDNPVENVETVQAQINGFKLDTDQPKNDITPDLEVSDTAQEALAADATSQGAQVALSDLIITYAENIGQSAQLMPENMAAWLEDAAGGTPEVFSVAQAGTGSFASLDALAFAIGWADAVEGPELKYALFDDGVRAYIDFLLQKNGDVQVVSHASEVVFLDKSAFSGSDAQVYARSWSFEDGGVISTIGLRSDLEAFDLIA